MNAIKVKVKKKFTNPLSGHKLKPGDELNVPHNQFWLKRIEAKDCEKIKLKVKSKQAASNKKADAKKSKGSK